MEMVNLKINNLPLQVKKGTRIIDAAKEIGINIPHLCYFPDQEIKAHCRICVVEVKGSRKLLASCSTVCWEGMEVFTDTQKVRDTQVGVLEMIMANHKMDCLTCRRNQNCELQALCSRFNLVEPNMLYTFDETPIQDDNPSLVRDMSKCIKCGRCVRACLENQGVAALTYSGRSENFAITTAYKKPFEHTDCVLCGQCSTVCPVGSIVEKDDTQKIWDALHNPQKHVIVQVAPSVRVALGDAFGMKKGAIVTGKMVSALKMIGFDKVFDTNFSADLTIMEEGHELLDRIKNGGKLPMITSCSPGWINYIEKHHSDLLDHLSTAKSPQQMFGAISKTYYAKVAGIDPKDIVTVSVMPCVAKKFEAARPEMEADGIRDVDIVITTRELAKMIKYVGLDFQNIPDSEFDSPLGIGSGAGAIFGNTGGVMEAALRTVAEVVTGEELGKIEFNAVRGNEGVREAAIPLGDSFVKVAIAHGLKNAEKVMQMIQDGTADYTFIEIMACPGGCIGGGGQPVNTTFKMKELRQDALYAIDESLPYRKSHKNPEIITLYKDFLGEPLGETAHHLLHTHYHQQRKATSNDTF